MKKILFFAAFAALLSVASCQKEAVDKSVESPIFTATIAGESKTTIDLSDGKNGKITWEDSDEITVKDASSKSAIYVIESIDDVTRKATFVIKDGETALGAGPYSATYGSAPATNQTYSATNNNLYKGNLYMAAPETSSNSFTFTVACGLMKLKLTKAGESVKSVTVTGIPTGGSETTYTLNCESAESIATAKDFFIALPAGTYTRIEVANASGLMCILKTKADQPLALENNHIKPVTLSESIIDFNAIPGVFSVRGRKVYFSRGNLQAKYNGSNYTWDFAANQYDYIGKAAGNTTITADGKNNTNAVVDLFGWSTNKSNYGINTSCSESTYSGGFKDWGLVIDDRGTWSTLSNDDWVYLFNTRSASTVNGVSNARYALATVNGKAGMILLPDSYTHPTGVTNLISNINSSSSAYTGNSYNTDDWAKLESAGAVFLPAAGYRDGSSVNVSGYGTYWSSSADGENRAFRVYFESGYVELGFSENRFNGSSVRLVTNAN